jgi:hypothetical protein
MRSHIKKASQLMLTSFAVACTNAAEGSRQQTAAGEHGGQAAQPTQPGQSAFAAISEIVRLLEADATTDWSRVNLEALRQHLIDMDLVTLRSNVRASDVASGLALEVTGDAQVAAAIQRMLTAHAAMLNEMSEWSASAVPISGGVRLTVAARSRSDSATMRRIRALGFAGLLVQGDHHTMHHMMIARGEGAHAHGGAEPAPGAPEHDR